MTDARLRQTALSTFHREEGARLVDFAGWEMPVQFSGIAAEHLAVRRRAGRFDVSHMGRLYIDGAGALDWLETMLPARINRMRIGQMVYSVLCNEGGGAVDDLALYRRSPTGFLLVVNASRTTADIGFLRQRLPAPGAVSIEDRTEHQAMIAVQGPAAAAALRQVHPLPDLFPHLDGLGFFRFREAATVDGEWLLSRSGYTGEDGFEIICPAAAAGALWQGLAAAGVDPVGLGARDTLRTEMGYPLYGHELSHDIGPVEAGLQWALALDKPSGFCGRQGLQKRMHGGPRLMGLRLEDKGIPRPGYEVRQNGRRLGSVTSGTYSPCLQAGIALALIDTDRADPASIAAIVVRGRQLAGRFVDLPFVPSRVKRRRRRRGDGA